MLVGSTIFIKELNKGTISGLDGSFLLKNIPEGIYTSPAPKAHFRAFGTGKN